MTAPGTEPRPAEPDAAVEAPAVPEAAPPSFLQRARSLWCALISGLG